MHCCVCKAETQVIRVYRTAKKAVLKKSFQLFNVTADWLYTLCDKNDVDLTSKETMKETECTNTQE